MKYFYRSFCIAILLFSMSVLGFGQVPAPAPIFSDVLTTVKLRSNGQFKPGDLYGYFLKPGKGSMKVFYEGAEIAGFSFHVEQFELPKYRIGRFDLVSGKNDVLGLKLKKPGSYELRYAMNGKTFYKFAFRLVTPKSNDPYAPAAKPRLDGPWNEYAYLRRTSNESHGKWEFRIFLRSKDGKLQQSQGQIIVTRDSDKKVVAVGSNGFRLERRWVRQDFTLKKPGKKNAKGIYYSNTDLLAARDKFASGSYTASLTVNGNIYGRYRFDVKDGAIQPSGRQVRETTDPTTFLEGGGREYWLMRDTDAKK